MELFIFVSALLVVLLWSLRAWKIPIVFLGNSHKKLPPGPIPLPIVGRLFELGNKPNESLTRFSKIYGPLMTLRLGRVTTIVASSPEMAKEILQTHDQVLASRTITDSVTVQNRHQAAIVWLPPYSHWRSIRKLLNNHIFSVQRLQTTKSLRRLKVQKLLDHVGNNANVGQAVDIGEVSFITTLNLLSNIVFSVDVANLEFDAAVQEFKAAVRGIVEEAGKPNLSDYFPVLKPFDLQGIKRRSVIHFDQLHKLFNEMIDERLKNRASIPSVSKNNDDLLDALLDHYHDKSLDFGRFDINALLSDLFIAGTDTTSSAIEWSMAELLQNPEKMAKLQLELRENVAEGKPVDETDIARLPYLQAVVKETMRLHPAAPLLIPHRAETEVEICGFTVPKDAQVLVNIWAIARDPSTWPNPDLFLPERFLDSSGIDVKGRDFELIPFGSGRRICPGMPLALRTVPLMLASLLQSFDWRIEGAVSPKDMDMDYKFGVTLQKALPLRAIPFEVIRSQG